MPYPYLEAHNIDPDGFGRGTYSHVPCPFRNINATHNAIEIHHSLFEGDRMTFFQILQERGDALDKLRPIRFYTEDGGVKLFDGKITDTDYTYIGGDYMALKVEATGWWLELAGMDLHHPVTYADTWTVNEIYLDLVRRANDMGMMKQAVYKYDTSKIPEYATYSSYYEAVTGTEIVVTNVYEGMKVLTRVLDSTMSAGITPPTYEWGLRVEALPRTDGITQSNTETGIYILPLIINPDKATAASFKRFQLIAGMNGYNVRRDYHRLANDVLAVGSGFESQQIRTTQPLTEKIISSADQSWARDAQVLASHYLKVTLENPTAAAMNGYIIITRVSGATNPTETFPMHVPANTTQIHFTSDRTEDGLPVGNCFRAVGFNGGKITVEEVSNTEYAAPDTGIFHTAIAGKSLNTYGQAPHLITDMWLNSQQRVDLAAGKHCRLYHAPTHQLYAPIISRYVNYDNLIGNTAAFYSPYDEASADFLITDTVYGFRGALVTQQLAGMRYEYDWDFDGS